VKKIDLVDLHVGQKFTWHRTFTPKDVEMFAELSGDKGAHHMQPDKEGRIMVHGLLTATIPTKIGGDLNYIARSITFEFVRPVFVGDTITAESTIRKLDREEKLVRGEIEGTCYNQDGKTVLEFRTSGVIRS